ncbi:MAG: NCS2 family permease [Erysipelotrichaceae bacterium]|nr:NCS2 family permease [Erysipelotrichaceae bacterium]
MDKISKFFKFKERGTSFNVELIAGLTTFMTMAYVLVLQPNAIVGFGVPEVIDVNGVLVTKEAIMITTALVSCLITLFMAFYANLPFALSCGMGVNFMFGGMLQSGSISFAQIMGMIMVSGIVFVTLSVFGVRDLIVRMIPRNIKVSIGTCIGFFIAYLGLKSTGICDFSSGLAMGDFTKTATLLSLFGLLIIAALTAFKVKGAMLIGIVITTIIGIPLGITTVPTAVFSVPSFSTVSNVVWKMDFSTIWTAEGAVLMFIAFFGDFFSTLGTVLGVGGKAGMLDKDGNLPGIEKPFIVDAIGTCVGAAMGCTTITTFVESSAGVEAGGRTGFTSVVTGLLFFIMMFFSPLVLMIPDAATGPALIFVGFLMIQGFKEIDFSDFTESFGPFVMIMFGTFMGSIAAGIAAGILAFIFIKVITGKFKDVHPGMYVLAIPLLLYFIYA